MQPSKLIIVRNAGKEVPMAFLELVCPKFTTYSGMAFLKGGAFLSKHYNPANAKQVHDFLQSVPDTNALIVLGGGNQKPHDDDRQPFTLFAKDGQPRLVCAVEGEFNNFAQKDSAHEPEFFVANTGLIPMLQPSFDAHDGDVVKMLDEIQMPVVKNALISLSNGKGSIVFMANTGRLVVSTAKRDNVMPFGWVSSKAEDLSSSVTETGTGDFGDLTATPTPAVPAPAPAVPVVPTVSPPSPATPAVPDDLTATPKTDTAVQDPLVTVTLDDKFNNQQRKDIYRSYFGKAAELPGGQDWKREKNSIFKFQVKRSALKEQHAKLVKDIAPDSVLIPKKATEEPRDMRQPASPAVAGLPDPKTQNAAIEMISSGMFQKFISAGGEEITDPATWLKKEELKPAFTEHLALTLPEVEKWPDECWDTLVRGFPTYGRMAITQFRNEMIRLRIENATLKSKGAPASATPETKKEPEPAQVKAAANSDNFVFA